MGYVMSSVRGATGRGRHRSLAPRFTFAREAARHAFSSVFSDLGIFGHVEPHVGYLPRSLSPEVRRALRVAALVATGVLLLWATAIAWSVLHGVSDRGLL